MDTDRLAEAIHHAASGSAICFLGAGFSTLAKDSKGEESVPSTSELTAELWKLAKTPPEPGATLTDIAEFFDNIGRSADLRRHLVIRLTMCRPSVEQQLILSLPWRAVFTTNFDDLPERCIPSAVSQVVSPVVRPSFVKTDRRPIYYIHGRALDIVESNQNPGLILSERNYLELKSKNYDLYATFINETHAASQIFFIGYSLRDAEIASQILSLGETLRQKSIVICRDGEGAVAVSRLKKFGHVSSVGIEGLAKELQSIDVSSLVSTPPQALTFLKPLVPATANAEVTKDDVDRLIITGEFDQSAFAAQRLGVDSSNMYCIDHEKKIAEVFHSIDGMINRFIVTADVGNGKTIFLEQFCSDAIGRGFEVYVIRSELAEVYRDIDLILGTQRKVIFAIDDLIRHRTIAEYIGKRLHSNSSILCATRDSYDAIGFRAVTDLLSGAVREIHIDRLSQEQLIAWDSLLERWGYWEGRIELSRPDRLRFLQGDCSSENRSIVISVFKSSHISKIVDRVVAFFVAKNPNHLRSFIAILVASLCQKHVRWDQIVAWLDLDEDNFRRALEKEQVFDFLSGRREWYAFTSTQLADHIFRNFEFDRSTVVDVYTTIVRETAYSSTDIRSGADSRENLKELMKFRFLSRLFGEGADAAGAIESVYSRLSKVPKIRKNDQFWLQYAMSCMERRDLGNAETYIKTAMGIAENKGEDYSDDQIIDQRIRLMLMKNARREQRVSVDELETAMGDLERTLDESNPMLIYPIRAASYILELVDEKAEDLSMEMRKAILRVLDRMKEILESTADLPKSQRGETKKLTGDVRKARLVLQNA